MRLRGTILLAFMLLPTLASKTSAADIRSWLPEAWRNAKIEPVYSAQFLGGQYFFTDGNGAVSGNISGLAAPAILLNERWQVYPSLSSSYRGTKDVVDLVGAGTVFQEQMDHRLGLKAVYVVPRDTRWRVKPSISHTWQFLKETKDEGWSSGLFDYRKLDFGLEGEFVYRKPFATRAALSYFMTAFPNYTSLESQAATSFQGQSLARELVGDDVLDTSGQMLTLSGNAPLSKIFVEGKYAFLRQSFGSQKLVDNVGDLTSDTRSDITQMLEAGARYPHIFSRRLKMLVSIDLGLTANSSNQDNYDALAARHNKGFYDYKEHRRALGIQLTAGAGDRPVTMNLDFAASTRKYRTRKIQDSTGLYLSETLHTNSFTFSASVKRPIAPRLKALFLIQHGVSTSNQRYEQLYKYNYTATNYLFGVSYDY